MVWIAPLLLVRELSWVILQIAAKANLGFSQQCAFYDMSLRGDGKKGEGCPDLAYDCFLPRQKVR